MKKSPNKYTTWNKGHLCPNCNRVGWRFIDYLTKDHSLMQFYCIFCKAQAIKQCDFNRNQILKEFKEFHNKTKKGVKKKNGTTNG